jgi:hypothetical protein
MTHKITDQVKRRTTISQLGVSTRRPSLKSITGQPELTVGHIGSSEPALSRGEKFHAASYGIVIILLECYVQVRQLK